MKKFWGKPMRVTLTAQHLSSQIKAAAWSGEGVCEVAVFR